MRDKFAVVTGASTGIEAAIAERLAASGAHLVLVARSADKPDEAAARLSRQHGVTVRTLPLDLATADAPTRLADQGIEVEVLVNNAGLLRLVTGPHGVAAPSPDRRRSVERLPDPRGHAPSSISRRASQGTGSSRSCRC